MNEYFFLFPIENTDKIVEYFATTRDLSLSISLTQTDDL